MKIRTHSYVASLVAAIALMHPAANAADDRLWREQVPASPQALLTLDVAARRVAVASDDWLWREQLLASGTAPLYVGRATVDARPPTHALWREQLGRDMRHSPSSVAQSSEPSNE